MSDCTVCLHSERQVIEEDYRRHRPLPEFKPTYGVHHLAVLSHMRLHVATPVTSTPTVSDELKPSEVPMTVVTVDETTAGPLVEETPQDVLKLGLPYVRRAVRLAGDDREEQQRIVAVLNEALQDEHMGL